MQPGGGRTNSQAKNKQNYKTQQKTKHDLNKTTTKKKIENKKTPTKSYNTKYKITNTITTEIAWGVL